MEQRCPDGPDQLQPLARHQNGPDESLLVGAPSTAGKASRGQAVQLEGAQRLAETIMTAANGAHHKSLFFNALAKCIILFKDSAARFILQIISARNLF
jgi:hypothetical protein